MGAGVRSVLEYSRNGTRGKSITVVLVCIGKFCNPLAARRFCIRINNDWRRSRKHTVVFGSDWRGKVVREHGVYHDDHSVFEYHKNMNATHGGELQARSATRRTQVRT